MYYCKILSALFFPLSSSPCFLVLVVFLCFRPHITWPQFYNTQERLKVCYKIPLTLTYTPTSQWSYLHHPGHTGHKAGCYMEWAIRTKTLKEIPSLRYSLTFTRGCTLRAPKHIVLSAVSHMSAPLPALLCPLTVWNYSSQLVQASVWQSCEEKNHM